MTISRPAAVCNAFNDYFSSIASSFGNNDDALKEFEDIESILAAHSDHPSIRCIQENFANSMPFDFTEITVENMRSLIREMDPKKGAGFDNIPPKILKIASDELAEPMAALLNDSIRNSEFPGDLKMSELSPLFKNKDSLYRGNYRPVNILPCISKLFEKVYADQLRKHFDDILSSLLAAFRKNYGCQHVLIKLIEDCKIALDSREYVGLVLTDLSKAFDCLPHRLLLCKLYNYGLSKKACQLIRSYLDNRKQRVKIGCERSTWSSIYKGVPQGSVLGPILFNIFMNDILYKFKEKGMIYNYADDNTICARDPNPQILKTKMEYYAEMAIKWFEANYMKANPSKFQTMIIKSGQSDSAMSIDICGEKIEGVNHVKLLGVNIDHNLNFDQHISIICSKASTKIKALGRIARYLTQECRRNIYCAFILPNFIYCCTVWHFCSKSSTLKLERVNKKALRIVLNDYNSSYSDLLHKACQTSLYISRIKAIAIEMYKCKFHICPEFVEGFFSTQQHSYSLRGGEKLNQPIVNTNKYGLHTFRYEGAKIWNEMPLHIKSANDLDEFKAKIRQWSGPRCICGSCTLCNINALWYMTI